MVAAKEEGALGEAAVVAEGDLAEVVNPYVLADPAVVTDGEFPGVLDGDARLEDHAAPHFGAEKAQEEMGKITEGLPLPPGMKLPF